jgi:hypothetical protein
MSKKLFSYKKLHWNIYMRDFAEPWADARCPHCHCEIEKSEETYRVGEYKYRCIDCDFKITLDKEINDLTRHMLKIREAQTFKDAEIISIDNELIKVQRKYEKDDDYWIDAKISKNRKGELQLMVMAGSRKPDDKAQLFIEPTYERLAFDQSNKHPKEIFAKVEATFKNSKSTINDKN